MAVLFAALAGWFTIASALPDHMKDCDAFLDPYNVSALATRVLDGHFGDAYSQGPFKEIVQSETDRLIWRWKKRAQEDGKILNPEHDLELTITQILARSLLGIELNEHDLIFFTRKDFEIHLRLLFVFGIYKRPAKPNLLDQLSYVQARYKFPSSWAYEQFTSIFHLMREMLRRPLRMAIAELARNPEIQILSGDGKKQYSNLFAREVFHQYPPVLKGLPELSIGNRDEFWARRPIEAIQFCPPAAGRTLCLMSWFSVFTLEIFTFHVSQSWSMTGPWDLNEPSYIRISPRRRITARSASDE